MIIIGKVNFIVSLVIGEYFHPAFGAPNFNAHAVAASEVGAISVVGTLMPAVGA